jgi:hypothetical protein
VNDPQSNPQAAVERAAEAAGEARKPYCKPSFQFEQVFETMALQCGKIGSTSFSCAHSSSAS